jgi:hypothetical protein
LDTSDEEATNPTTEDEPGTSPPTAKTTRVLRSNKEDPMTLRYKGRSVNAERFNPKGKDLRRLVGHCHCGKRLIGTAAIPSPDPFALDILHDNTPVVQCKDCQYESHMST